MSTWIKPEHKEPVLSKINAFTKGEIIYILPQVEQLHRSMGVYWYYAVVQVFTPTEQKILIRLQHVEPHLTGAVVIAREDS